MSSSISPLPSRSLPRSNAQKVPILEETSRTPDEILAVIDSLKTQVDIDRCLHIKKRMEENRKKMSEDTNNHFNLSVERENLENAKESVNLLTKRMITGMNLLKSGESDSFEDGICRVILLGSNLVNKSSVCPILLPELKKIPSYTTWSFLDRNQRMLEDQSVVGRRRIYYDQHGGEALLASDSDEEKSTDDDDDDDDDDDEEEEEEEEHKEEFLESEDYIIRVTIEEVGLSDAAFDLLGQYLSKNPSEIKARYEVLMKSKNVNIEEGTRTPYLDKDLDAALDSFDNLFCRRCLVFDCRLHGCSQDLIYPADEQVPWSSADEDNVPCGPNCFRLITPLSVVVPSSDSDVARIVADSSQNRPTDDITGKIVEICDVYKNIGKRVTEEVQLDTSQKRQKKMGANSDSLASESLGSKNINERSNSCKEKEYPGSGSREVPCKAMVCYQSGFNDEENNQKHDVKSWKSLEKSLFKKGLEIFGKNSCLIARNLLNGMKTCSEVYHLIINCSESEKNLPLQLVNGKNSLVETSSKADSNENTGTDLRRLSRFLRRRGRVRRLKYTWKSTGHNSYKKRISERKDEPYTQYNPCACENACTKECPCFVNRTCCEKYCGCPRSCKKRFRGCHCAKSQCRSRQCPCFAASRECDPDVCRNCWISCGDGTLGTPLQRGENYECRNMKLLLKQQQRVLLGRSDIDGWGAFLKNSVNKNEYLGEYTGEIISHREADKRGKIYDRVNSSFLFNLNNQYVLDAFRKGNKLKFANHSPNPNCYAKVIMVAGDHRVGIFAKEKINTGEELFYDYRYEADKAPAWAKKPSASGSKKDDPSAPSTSGRAKKIA